MSSKFQLNIPNRLPKGLEAQALINTDQVIAALLEQGLEEQAKPFLQDLTADTKRDPLATWTRWEGYYVEHKDSVTLCVVGALYFQGQIYVRGLVVLNVPDNILVIGNPEGLTGTISDGMIAAIRHYPKNWLQITAPISPGSSGSPVINDQGEVVGIVEAFHTEGQNLNIAIPAEEIGRVADGGVIGGLWPLYDYADRDKARPVPMVQERPQPTHDEVWAEIEKQNKVTELVLAYLAATQDGKPCDLSPYCTTILGDWYGQKNLSIQQAQAEIADYYRTWPYQSSYADKRAIGVTPLDRKDAYLVTVPFHWAVGNGKKSQEGDSLLCAVVLLTTNSYGYRICAVRNEKIGK